MHEPSALPGASVRWTSILLLSVILALFALRNLPWQLDDYDQAKQAFVSFEMVQDGQWWFQHTPAGRIATKPPLAGWISAAFFAALGGHGWEVAWRLPALLSALALLGLLWKGGRALDGERGAALAVAAFGLNLLAPRLATLVRTDMMLALLTFFAGWLIWKKVRSDSAWTSRERWQFGLAILASMLTKGPIVYAFLLPGLAAFAWFARRDARANRAWCGWLPWTLPLLAFALWVGIGVAFSQDFYRQVVLMEFLGRFDLSDHPIHKHQPFWFYLPHLLHKWLPWSAALLALACSKRLRIFLRREPALLWLACWAVGGFVCMSLVPSKRVDRIFPVIPPLCLLLVGVVRQWLDEPPVAPGRARWLAAITLLAALISIGYSTALVARDFRQEQRALVHLGEKVREFTAGAPARLAVVPASDEGLLLYTRRTRFTALEDAVAAWRRGDLDWMLVRQRDVRAERAQLEPFAVRLETPDLAEKHGPYQLIQRMSGKSPAISPAAPTK